MSKFLFIWAGLSEFAAVVTIVFWSDESGAATTAAFLGLQAIISFGFGAVVYTLNKRKAEQETAASVNA